MSHFDKVGGRGTIRSVWNKLKSNNRVKGQKRILSDSSDSDDESLKRCKISLNVTETCERINNIELSGEEELSIILSEEEESDDRVFEDADVINEWHERERMVGDLEEEPVSVSGDEWWNASGADSMPPLASPDQLTSEGVDSESDSGVIEEIGGGVTNLCIARGSHEVRSGIITETGPFIPVSLGFSMSSTDGSWEEVVDRDGNPTRMERKSFRLNVVDGRTESIDDYLDYIRRLNGLPDEVNNRRIAGLDDDPNEQYYADVSEDEHSSLESDNQIDRRDYFPQSRCSRATLKPSCQNILSQRWYSRATLSWLPDIALIDQPGCSRATLRNVSGGEGDIDRLGCSRATLRNYYRRCSWNTMT